MELSEDQHKQLWVPPGFAHGFLALTYPADVMYNTTDYYARVCDRGIAGNDPDIGIDWPLRAEPILSAKGAAAPRLREAEMFP